jgi:hypothetical protein
MDIKTKKLIVNSYARGKEDQLVQAFIVAGPTAVKKTLGIRDAKWMVIFDYLVFEHDLLEKCVAQNVDFFKDLYVKFGIKHIRAIFEVEGKKYDMPSKAVFDLIAVVNEGLYLHVLQNRGRYLLAFKARGGDFLRTILGILDKKYDKAWEMVLDILLNAECDGLFSERTLEHGLQNFAMMMNGVREHRALNKYKMAA